MSDLNKKNINYGALNRFYQDLKSHDLSDLNDKIDNIDVPEYVAGEGIAIDSANTISCTVKPIADVSVLPDAEANKDSVLRLEGDKKLYVAKYNPQIVPDAQQVGVAYVTNDEGTRVYYTGTEVTIIAPNGTFTGYAWVYEGKTISSIESGQHISTTKAEEITDDTALFYNGQEIAYVSGTTFEAIGALGTLTMRKAWDLVDGYYIKKLGYQWKRVVTEDELDGIGDVFQALEARIYALEHPTTIE